MGGPFEAMRRARRGEKTVERAADGPTREPVGSDRAHAAHPCPIAEAPDRVRVRLEGNLRTVTLRPRGGVPALEAELHDGSGGVALVWLGRRRIEGISPGRALVVEGRIGRADKQRVIYNPRYELLG